jgi:ribonuclease HII
MSDLRLSRKCGVDEAGRGPVLGPLVVAAVMVEDDAPLIEMGVRDSKKLTRARRIELHSAIHQVADTEVVIITHDDIDKQRASDSLNSIEARAFATALLRFRGSRIFADAADVDPHRFKRMVCSHLDFDVQMICEHKADEQYPVVSAASIVAKETRDSIMDRISEELGKPVGSGYASDPITIAFLENWISEKGDLPPYARRSWDTSRRLLNLSRTRRLTDWTD